MIRALCIKDPKGTCVPHLKDTPALNRPGTTFTFLPGINILWGPNGSGKSTLIQLMALLLHCRQSGSTVVTNTSQYAVTSPLMGAQTTVKEVLEAVQLDHDGQSTRYFDPQEAVGLSCGGAAFDFDYLTEGLKNVKFRGSRGQTTLFRLEDILKDLHAGTIPPVRYRAQPSGNQWEHTWDGLEEFLRGTGPQEQPTVLLDEPDQSLDVTRQMQLWRFIRAHAERVQFIVAAHSLWALDVPEANLVSLDDRYLMESFSALATIKRGWRDERPLGVGDVAD